jgi:hypothetical protein
MLPAASPTPTPRKTHALAPAPAPTAPAGPAPTATAQNQTPRGANELAWSEAILTALGDPLTDANIVSLGYWMQNEAGATDRLGTRRHAAAVPGRARMAHAAR